MRLTFRKVATLHWSTRIQWILCLSSFYGLLFGCVLISTQQFEEGDSCTLKSGAAGICTEDIKCVVFKNAVEKREMSAADIVRCGFTRTGELICCPNSVESKDGLGNNPSKEFMTNFLMPQTRTSTTRRPTTTTRRTTTTTRQSTTTTRRPSTTTRMPEPLIIGNQEVNANDGFIDLSTIFNQNMGSGNTQTVFMPNSQNPFSHTHEAMQQQPTNNFQQQPWNNNNQGNFNPNRGQRGPNKNANQNMNINSNRPVIMPPQRNNIRWPNENPPNRDARPNNNGQMVWIGNNDLDLTNPSSPNIFNQNPSKNLNNAGNWQDINNPDFWNTDVVSNNMGNNNMDNFDPIAHVNNNLMASGMDIIKAELVGVERELNQPLRSTTRQPSVNLDPFKHFQFRPNSNEVELINNMGGDGQTTNANFITNPIFSETKSESSTLSPIPTRSVDPTEATKRKAVLACERIENNLTTLLTEHILGGEAADWGEFPHMVALGYPDVSTGGIAFRCGGSLIDTRYVLTAAHCVNDLRSQPQIARMGVVDFNNVDQMKEVQEINIKNITIHDDYSGARKYHDIAIIELEHDAKYTEYVAPLCLYTHFEDPPSNSTLKVTGWGTTNVTTRETSDRLLKAPLQIFALDGCNKTYVDFGLNRNLNRGIADTQLCAYDPEAKKDACQGDSGGPLTWTLDEANKYFRLIGIISTGYGCGSAFPGIYTRVFSYLDWIEAIVWP